MELSQLKSSGDAPEWMTEAGFTTISKGYLDGNETPKAMYRRVAKSAARGDTKLARCFFKIIWNNWLCPATPVLTNSGTDKGFNISCFTNDVGDSMGLIMDSLKELAMLTKGSGGVGVNFSRIRPRGTPIKGGRNGKSEGIIPFAKMFDSAIIGVSQGSRRGAASINLNIEHGDWEEFVRMRRPEGDVNRQCLNLNHCAVISDEFMNKVISGDIGARNKWSELLKARMETGEPYLMFKDNVNKANPEGYKKLGLDVSATNICSEITLHTDPEHTFVCCLSSLNLARWDEWKDTSVGGMSVVELSIRFLDGVLSEFIDNASHSEGMEKAVRAATKGRALGLGVLGWHTLLQSKELPFEGFQTMMLNSTIFKQIKEQSVEASKKLATELGEPLWCKGTGLRNTHLLAIAPTRSNSIISGDVSAGIEPIIANSYVDKTSKGTFIRKNEKLKEVFIKYNKDTDSIWKDISNNYGSVQDLDFLSDNEKEVFKTAYEIDQSAIIRQAAQRQQFICQSQSLNLFVPVDITPSYFNQLHILAWELGVKTLYYCRSRAGIKVNSTKDVGCSSCEG